MDFLSANKNWIFCSEFLKLKLISYPLYIFEHVAWRKSVSDEQIVHRWLFCTAKLKSIIFKCHINLLHNSASHTQEISTF